MGGDEFAVIIDKNISEQDLVKCIDAFLHDISSIVPDKKVSCSIEGC